MFVHTLARKGFNVAIHDPQVTQEGFDFEMKEQGLSLQTEGKENGMGRIEFFGQDLAQTV